MTPKEYKQMMDYLTRSGVRKQVKFASDIARPDPKPVVKEIELFNAFNRRNPKADGGRIGFRKGLSSRTDYTQGKGTDTFSEVQKNKIKKAFNISDAAFEKSGTKFGVPTGFDVPGEEGKSLRRKYALVKDFVNRGFKEGSKTLATGFLRKEDQLPLKIQTEIKTKYELPEDYVNSFTGKREWDFKRYPYGVPARKGSPLRSLARKIQYEFTRDPKTKKFKFVGDFKTPNGWMMAQMYRSGVEQGSGNYEPVFGKVNNTKKIVGFKDNIVGDTFYVRDEFVKPGGKPMRLHPDFNNVKKFVDVANKANAPLNKTLTGLLKKIGVEDSRMTMTTLLNYLAKEEGFQATNRALVLHHKGGVGANATKDLQLLRNINNNAIQAAENRIRSSVNLNQTPDSSDIKILKDNKASVVVGGKSFGSGPQTAQGAFKSFENLIKGKLERGEIDPKALTKFADNQFTLRAKIPLVEDLYNMAKSIPDDIAKKSFLKAGFKTLGIAAAPLVVFDTYKAFEQGKPVLEALEQGFIGTDLIGGTKRVLSLTPEERLARSVVKQDALKDLNLEMPMGFGFIEGPAPKTDMTLQEAQQKMDAGIQRVKEEEAQKNLLRSQGRGFGTPVMADQFLADGGIAGLSGGDKSGPPPEKGPMSQGLPGLLKRVKKP